MSIRGSNFDNQHPFASDHALVWERCMPDGLLYGVEMSFTPTLFTLGTGFMLIAGRAFEITAAENISISPGSGYARVYVTIDTGGTATENNFDQVSFGVDYAASLDSFAELTQGEININQGAAVYQAEVAVLAINSSGVTAIERQIELVSPGAGTGAFAAIAVTYPAGATVTVTDGKITYTAPNTNGAALFIIPYAATWTVTATDGSQTANETVEITSESQVANIILNYAPTEGLLAEYTFNTFDGNTAPDSSGNDYNLTLTNVTQVAGIVGKAASFAGNGGAVANSKVIPDGMAGFDGLTVSFWVKASGGDQATTAYLISQNNAVSGLYILLETNGKIKFSRNISGYGDVTFDAAVDDTAWHHVCIVYDYATKLGYGWLDGVIHTTNFSCNKFTASTANTTIGKHPVNAGSYFTGGLDQIRMYDRAITDEEVAELYNGGAGC